MIVELLAAAQKTLNREINPTVYSDQRIPEQDAGEFPEDGPCGKEAVRHWR